MQRLFLILIVVLFSCTASSKLKETDALAEKNKDVAILSLLIHDHLVQTGGRSIDLNELIHKDSLKRISNNFKSLVMKSRGGHLAVYYQVTNTRNLSVDLTHEQKQMLQYVKWKSKKAHGDYDGEIQLDYGERFYRVRKILIVKKNSNP